MMTDESWAKLRRSLIRDEAKKNYPYRDTENKITIGIGYNLTDRGISDEWIYSQYQADVDYHYTRLMRDFDWFDCLDDNRKIALINMCYNLGYKKFLGFTKMIAALSRGDYGIAAEEMLDSRWADQVQNRAKRLAYVIRTGELDV